MISLVVHVYTLGWVPVPVWFVVGFLALLAVSILVALVTGRMIRGRDEQVPTESIVCIPEVEEDELL